VHDICRAFGVPVGAVSLDVVSRCGWCEHPVERGLSFCKGTNCRTLWIREERAAGERFDEAYE
jgi:hypothetical protein